MSEYKGIKGFQVQTRTEDPVPYAQALADNPYAGTWASGGTMNTPRSQSGSSGTQTSGLVFAGDEYPTSPRLSNKNEYYNGTGWTELAEVNTARRLISGAGASHTSAIAFAGYTTTDVNNTETWDGSSWSEVNEMTTARQAVGETGTATAALAMGGRTNDGTQKDLVESWDGTNWTEVNELNTARRQIAGLGTYTAAFAVNGGPPASSIVEQWNGSTWTETTENNTARYAGGACGTVTAGLFFGGTTGSVTGATEDWNGTAWTEVNDLSTARKEAAPSVAGTSTVALASGGHTDPAKTGATEEWAFTGLDPSTTPAAGYADAITGDFYYNSTTGQFKNISLGVGSWASGGNMNRSVSDLGAASAAPQTAALGFGGESPPGRDSETEKYDGTSWTETGDLNSARNSIKGAGTQTAAIGAGGTPSPSNPVALTETFDGSSWTEVSDLNTGRYMGWMTGTTTAALAFGGYNASPNPPSTPRSTEEWDGSSWTAGGNLNTGGLSQMGFGIQTATTTSKNDATVEQYNGSSWTEITENNTGRSYGAAGGLYTEGVIFGGETPPGKSALTELWDGTSWTETGDMSTARNYVGGSSGSSSTAGIVFGGSEPASSNKTEEFTRTLFTIKTVTTS